MRPARGRALIGAVALAAATAAWVGPGAAPAAAYVCSLTVDTPKPSPSPPAGTSTVRFSGSFTAAPTPDGRTLEVSFLSGPGPLPPTVTWSHGDAGDAGRYQVDVAGLNHNGTYKAQVKATHTASSDQGCEGGEAGAQPTTLTKEVVFGVSVRARPPANVRARFEAAPRSAVVTWEKSPDPDTAGYSVNRKVGSSAFQRLGDVPADARSWTDSALPAGAATVTYAVSSSRVGFEPGTTSLPSPAAGAAPLEVPAAPAATPTSKAATGAIVTPGDRAAPADRTAARRVAVPSPAPFVLGRAVGGSGGPPELDFPDGLANPEGAQAVPGDEPVLRYRPNLGDDEVPLPDDSDQAFAAGRRGVGDDGTQQLAYVAAGLLSAVVAAHVLWLRSQALRPASEVVETAVPLEPVVVAPVPERAPHPGPAEEAGGPDRSAAARPRPAAPVVVPTAPPPERFAPPAKRAVPPAPAPPLPERAAAPASEGAAPPRAERAVPPAPAPPRAERAVPASARAVPPQAEWAAPPAPAPTALPPAEGAVPPGSARAVPPQAEWAAPPAPARSALPAEGAAQPAPARAVPPRAEQPVPPAPARPASRPSGAASPAPGRAVPPPAERAVPPAPARAEPLRAEQPVPPAPARPAPRQDEWAPAQDEWAPVRAGSAADRAAPLVSARAAAPVAEPAGPPVSEAVSPLTGAPAEPAAPARKRGRGRPVLVVRAPGKARPAPGARP